MKVKKNSILIFVILGSIFGYPLVAGVSTTLALPNSVISFCLRATVAFLSLYLIIDNVENTRKGLGRILLYFILAFALIYISRLTYETVISPDFSLNIAVNYWIWTIGSAFLPVIGISLARNYHMNFYAIYITAFRVTFIASIFVALNISTSVTNQIDSYDTGRARLETLNPISLGHLGASLLLLSIASFWQVEKKQGWKIFLSVVGAAFGAALVVASNSRGPMVGAAGALFFAWISLSGRRKGVLTLVMIVAALGFAPTLLWFENTYGVTTYSRLFDQSFGDEINVVARLDLYRLALQAFLDHPAFGAALDVAEVGSYPHNVTIEAFLSVGIIGGILFFLIQIIALVVAWRICRVRKDLVWASMIIVQYMLASQFSGALYASPPFWAVIGMAVFMSSVSSSVELRMKKIAKNEKYAS